MCVYIYILLNSIARNSLIFANTKFVYLAANEEFRPLQLQQMRYFLGQRMYRNLGLTLYHIYQPGDIQISGKTQKNIVGYDHDSVYVLGDSKKKPLTGNTELKSNMVLPTVDVCADFAVAVSKKKTTKKKTKEKNEKL